MTLPEIAVTDVDQNVTYSLSYLGGQVNTAQTVVKGALSVQSITSINATDITVVLSNKPDTDLSAAKFALTVNGTAVASPTALAKVDSDLAGKTYKLTVASLTNQEGKLTVNGFEKAFDFKSPEVVSVVSKGTKTIEVTFNEAIKDTTAITSNFDVKKVADSSFTVAEKPVISADGTKVTITWNDDKNLTVADYILVLGTTGDETATNRIKDVSGNSIYGGTEISFRPTAEQLAVKEAPSITTAEYNNGTGVVNVTFTKDVTAANVDATKLTIGGVALTTSDIVAQGTSNSITLTLSADTKTAVNAVTGALSFVGSEDAWTDGTTATKGQTVTITKVTPAVISSVAYNQETKVLTVNFDQAVKIQTLANIKVNDTTDANLATADSATNPDGTALDTTKAKATWELKLADVQSAALEDSANDKTKLKVYLLADAVRNDNTKVISNVATTYTDGGVAVAYTADTTKPYVTSSEFDNRTNTLKITFSEALADSSVTNINAVGAVKIATAATGDTNEFDLNAETVSLDTTKKVLTTQLTGNQAKLDAQYLTGKTIKVWFVKDALVDKNGLKNDATTFDTGIALSYKDFVAPQVGAATDTLNQKYIKVVFNEQVDKATAETAANYVIKDLSGNTLAVNSAALQSDKKTVYLNTAAQESGKPYTLTVNSVRDLQQNLVDTTHNTKVFYGSSTLTTGNLGVSSLVATAPVSSKNDTLAVTFDAPVNQTESLNVANYAVLEATADTDDGWSAAKAVSLSDAKAEVNSNGNVVTLTLGSYNLQSGKFYKVVVTNVTDAYGNALDSTKTTAKTTALDADNLVAPSIVESNTKTAAVVLTFNQELNATEAVKATNYKVGGTAPAKATYAWDGTNAIVTLDLGTALTSAVDVNIKDAVTNLAGETINGTTYTSNWATLTAPISLTDKVAPIVDTTTATINNDAKDDTIVIAFKDSDILAGSATNTANYVVKDTQGTVIPSADYTITFNDNALAGNDTVTLRFNGDASGSVDKTYNLQANGTYTVTISGILDNSGNGIAPVTKTATLVNQYVNGDTVTVVADGTVTITPSANNVYAVSGTADKTLGNITITASNVDIKKASTNDFAVRVYNTSGQQVTLSDSTTSSIKTLLFGQLSGGTSKQLVANIGMNYGQLKTAINNVAGTTAGSIQVDLFDLAGNKTTVTLNIQ